MRRALRTWYVQHGRHDLPWRLTRDSYAVLVSEVMLQQTQVARVLPYFAAWLARWPTFSALAAEAPAEVIRAWAGLGYNRRGLALHHLALEVAGGHGGGLPRDPAGLRALPGIGPYTASAVGSFAFEQAVPVVDTNIARVVARAQLGVANASAAGAAAIAAEALRLLPRRGARDHNLALMDLGAMVCRARAPACGECPLRSRCAWRRSGYPEAQRTSKPAPRFETTARFARGRIVAILRSGASLTAGELAASLPAEHRAALGTYLAALEREGLVECAPDGAWSLPGG